MLLCFIQCVVAVSLPVDLPVVCSVNFGFELISCCQSHFHFVYFVKYCKYSFSHLEAVGGECHFLL